MTRLLALYGAFITIFGLSEWLQGVSVPATYEDWLVVLEIWTTWVLLPITFALVVEEAFVETLRRTGRQRGLPGRAPRALRS